MSPACWEPRPAFEVLSGTDRVCGVVRPDRACTAATASSEPMQARPIAFEARLQEDPDPPSSRRRFKQWKPLRIRPEDRSVDGLSSVLDVSFAAKCFGREALQPCVVGVCRSGRIHFRHTVSHGARRARQRLCRCPWIDPCSDAARSTREPQAPTEETVPCQPSAIATAAIVLASSDPRSPRDFPR